MKLKTVFLSFTFCLLAATSSAQANPRQKMLCVSFHAWQLKDRLDPAFNDKEKHCTLSCWLARRCRAGDVLLLGLGKEVADALGMGNAEWEDLEADARGIRLARKARSDRQCAQACTMAVP